VRLYCKPTNFSKRNMNILWTKVLYAIDFLSKLQFFNFLFDN